MRAKLPRRAVVTVVTLVCALAASMGVASQAQAVQRTPGLRPAPAALTWLKDAQISPRVFAYPSSFDLRTLGKVSSVKDQGQYGTCWAFAALGSLESNLLPGEAWDFSEDNLVWFSGFDGSLASTAYNNGGNPYMAAAYLTRWDGPFTEAQDPYHDGLNPSPSTMTVQKHVQDVTFLPPRSSALDNNDIKYALTTWGGVSLSMYASASLTQATQAYYYNGSKPANHGILIVGWDDDYPASNFTPQPGGNGAFLVKNSWGAGSGNQGYFWLSYYDTVAGYDDSGSVFRSAEPTTNFSHIYQHDPLGFVSYIVPDPSDQTDWFAARYVAASSDDVTAVGFWTLGPNAGYELYAASTLAGLAGNKVGSGSFAEFGYHTAKFATPYSVTQGQAFYVAVKLTVPNFRGSAVPRIAIEDKYSGYSSAASASANQSFISDTGSGWSDTTKVATGWGDVDVCLKAFTGGTDGPHTSVTGADTKWHRSAVTLTFTGSAAAGVDSTEYSLDSGANWTPVKPDGTYTVEAPSDHSNDGAHTILYRSTDKNGAVETAHSCTVKIDTTGPETKTWGPYKVRKYGYVTVKYRAADLASTATITIRIKTLGGATKQTLRIGAKATDTTWPKRFKCSLPRRRYRLYVYAVDPAGNTQSILGRTTLTVT